MRDSSPLRRACAVLVFLGFFLPCRAELLNSELGFFLDLPEGYALSSPVANGQFEFTDPTGKAKLQVLAYDGSRYPSAAAMRDEVKKRLSAQLKGLAYRFQDRDAYLCEISFSLSGAASHGYMLCLDGKPGERDFLVLSLVDQSLSADYEDFIVSAMDSFSVDAAGLRLPGPVSWFDFPLTGQGEGKKTISFNGAKLDVAATAASSKAAQGAIEREYRVLTAYAGVQGSWQEAWRRYYRMAYRDSYHRLDQAAFLIGLEIDKKNRAALGDKPSQLSDARAPARTYAEAALAWLQGFTYVRGKSDSDLLNPLDCALTSTGDCDARALLLAILLHHWNIDAGMAVSQEYSHAVGLVDLPGSAGLNAGIEADGKRYLVAETTDKVKPGLIAQEQSDPAKWIGIGFGF